MKNTIVTGLMVGVGMLITSIILSTVSGIIIPSIAKEYTNTAIFRSWSEPLMMLMFVQPLVLGIILSFLWNLLQRVFLGRDSWQKVLKFVFLFWVVTTIPGMIISYGTFQISLLMVVVWSINMLIELLVVGWLLVKIDKVRL